MKLVFLLLIFAVQAQAQESYRVIDGDTIKISNTYHRLHCIDAPERKQELGKEATQALEVLVKKHGLKRMELGRDKYGRIISEFSEINREMVRQGMAWTYRRYCSDEAYFEAEKEAIKGKRGVHAGSGHVEPWIWRRKK